MKYLEHKLIVHRDLALRNILVTYSEEDNSRYIVKVADFGLSRAITPGTQGTLQTSNFRIPFKWSAPEILTNGTYSSKSDVWR